MSALREQKKKNSDSKFMQHIWQKNTRQFIIIKFNKLKKIILDFHLMPHLNKQDNKLSYSKKNFKRVISFSRINKRHIGNHPAMRQYDAIIDMETRYIHG